ncbi:hypothetical protein [Pedobacter sp. UBA4863]|uniref:hypothetical protein n=1 Tax=Pedobacter sp. UBA4863 TaxID=1947060 RepID=UPI0025E63E1F|nr:hypothetical protein [Pedobacter sp. UBA4863]
MNTSEYNKKYYLNITKKKRKIARLKRQYGFINKDIANRIYKKGIVEEFANYAFNCFFTGTANPNYKVREQLKLDNEWFVSIKKEYDIDLGIKYFKPISIAKLTRYTLQYVSYLIKLRAIDRAFIVFEQNKQKDWHTHIMLNVVNSNIIDINGYLEEKWSLGISLNVPVRSQISKVKHLWYSVKEIDIYGVSRCAKEKVLMWNFLGDYKEDMREIRLSQIELTELYKKECETRVNQRPIKKCENDLDLFKLKNNIHVIVDWNQQRELASKYNSRWKSA